MVRGIARMRDTVKIVYGGGKGEERGGEGRGGWKEGENTEKVSQ